MATSEILQFASQDTGSNLLTQAEYEGDAQRTIGHQPGIARSRLENKVLRQVSLMAAGLAQYIAQNQNGNVTDGMTAQEIADSLLLALNNSVGGTVPDATQNVKGIVRLATVAEAREMTSPSYDVAITPGTLKAAFQARMNLSANAGYYGNSSQWLMQWGYDIGNVSDGAEITFPVSFGVSTPMIVVTPFYSTSPLFFVGANTLTKTKFNVVIKKADGTAATGRIAWLAVGY